MLPAVLTFVVSRTLGNRKLKGNLSLIPPSFSLASAADRLEGWISDTLTVCHRQRDLCFFRHILLPILFYSARIAVTAHCM